MKKVKICYFLDNIKYNQAICSGLFDFDVCGNA